MEFEKPSQAVIDAFDAVAPPPPVERRKMFGMPACFVNGNMFAGVYGRQIMLRLSESDREKLLRNGGEPFAPMGRAMREYVTVPTEYVGQPAKLRPWMKRAQAFGETLPPKQPKATKRKAVVAAGPAARARKRN
ncbi:MAG: TfoX family protein [Dehalococcoidia bacterium]|nr:MAG: TfoX family protein [Dehalococcoidia bacterium]